MMFRPVFLFCALLIGSVRFADASCGIYGGGPFYKPGAAAHIEEVRYAGYSEVIVWNIAVNDAGDLNFNYEFPICAGGVYVGNQTYPDFPANMAKLKKGLVKRVTFSVGSSNVGVFQAIRDLINEQGTGPTSILYKNFKALKAAIPAVDAIDFDDENCYDEATMVKFAVMLGDLGYKVALCPFTNMTFWKNVASQVNAQRPGTVDAVNLQCYDGGGGNNPADWDFGDIPVYPGVWNQGDSVEQTYEKMRNWRNTAGSRGGFLWLYDGVIGNSAAYAEAINRAFGLDPFATEFGEALKAKVSPRRVLLQGTLSDPDGIRRITAFVDGKRVKVRGDKRWKIVIKPARKVRKVKIVVIDGAGNRSIKTYRVGKLLRLAGRR